MALPPKRRRLAALIVLIGAAGVGTWLWRRTEVNYTDSVMLAALPGGPAVRAFVDVAMLRSAGVLQELAGPKGLEEKDYQDFVKETGFDYRTDLDGVAGAFRDGNSFLVVKGRFDFSRLRSYAKSHEGACSGDLCWLPATRADRKISYRPLSTDVLAVAVALTSDAASQIEPPKGKPLQDIGVSAVWISVPPSMLGGDASLPAGAKSFLGPLSAARSIIFTLGPVSPEHLELRLEAQAANMQDAATLATQLTATTDLLRKMLAREKMKPNPDDLSGVLTAGHFEAKGDSMTGIWPIQRKFLDNLVSGGIR